MGSTARRRKKPNHQASHKWRQQLVAIQERTDRTLNVLDSACDTLRGLEAEIEQFLDHYYSRVGASIERLQALERELEAVQSHAAPKPMRQEPPAPPLPGLDREIKTLYRSLAMQCHPDVVGEDADKSAAIRQLNEAYARRNLGELWKINRELDFANDQLSATEKLVRLQAHCERMKETLDAVEMRRAALEESPAYALMQRAFQLRLCGQDLIANVQAHLNAQIEAAKRDVVRARMRQLREAMSLAG